MAMTVPRGYDSQFARPPRRVLQPSCPQASMPRPFSCPAARFPRALGASPADGPTGGRRERPEVHGRPSWHSRGDCAADPALPHGCPLFSRPCIHQSNAVVAQQGHPHPPAKGTRPMKVEHVSEVSSPPPRPHADSEKQRTQHQSHRSSAAEIGTAYIEIDTPWWSTGVRGTDIDVSWPTDPVPRGVSSPPPTAKPEPRRYQ